MLRDKLKNQVESEDYMEAIRQLAVLMLAELDTRPEDWKPNGDSASDLGSELYPLIKEKIPEDLKGTFSGGQVMTAAHLAYRAFKGD